MLSNRDTMEMRSFNLLAIILVQQLLISLAKNIEQNLEVSQDLDVDGVFSDKVAHEKMFLLKATDGQSSNYLNYKAVYGLRYIPTRIVPPKAVLVENQDLISAASNSEEISNASEDELNDNFALSSNETVSQIIEDSTNESSQKVEVIKTAEAVESVVDENRKHIMRPNHRIEHALEFLAGRLKKLMLQTSHANLLPAKLSPQLTTLGRFLNLFSLVKVENLPCTTAMKPLKQLSGTCYSENECLNLGGTAVDHCANGFGVCCICKQNALTIDLSSKPNSSSYCSQKNLQLTFTRKCNLF